LANQLGQPFDTRYAAILALQSFFTGQKTDHWDGKYLPAFSALYDGLVDDDDEIRQVAACAASGVTGTYAEASTAGDGLVQWLWEHFGDTEEFKARAVCKMAGQPYAEPLLLTPAEDQFRKALDFDDSLFAAEEQNLFIDEVRETRRWQRAYEMLNPSDNQPAFDCLSRWVEAGLSHLVGLTQKEDGPLGWTSDQHVFAVCARVLLCAVTVAKFGKGGGIMGLLKEFVALGETRKIHGSLLDMARC
jgi:hypothetical protein